MILIINIQYDMAIYMYTTHTPVGIHVIRFSWHSHAGSPLSIFLSFVSIEALHKKDKEEIPVVTDVAALADYED